MGFAGGPLGFAGAGGAFGFPGGLLSPTDSYCKGEDRKYFLGGVGGGLEMVDCFTVSLESTGAGLGLVKTAAVSGCVAGSWACTSLYSGSPGSVSYLTSVNFSFAFGTSSFRFSVNLLELSFVCDAGGVLSSSTMGP